MRIYAVADIHGRIFEIEIIKRNIELYQPDLLIIAGDITGFGHRRSIVSMLDEMPVPVFTVRGNADYTITEQLFAKYQNLTSLHFNKRIFQSIPFAGLGGTIPIPFFSKICFNENKVLRKLTALVDPDTILVTHTPPFGVLDTVFGKLHVGSRNLMRFIVNIQPFILICGHIHENAGTVYMGRTLVINCALNRKTTGALIDIKAGTDPDVRQIIRNGGS